MKLLFSVLLFVIMAVAHASAEENRELISYEDFLGIWSIEIKEDQNLGYAVQGVINQNFEHGTSFREVFTGLNSKLLREPYRLHDIIFLDGDYRVYRFVAYHRTKKNEMKLIQASWVDLIFSGTNKLAGATAWTNIARSKPQLLPPPPPPFDN